MKGADNVDGRVSWRSTLPALGPFMVIPAVYTLGMILAPAGLLAAAGVAVPLFILGALLLALLVGWVQGFPRWVFPYWGFAGLIGLYIQGFTGAIGGKNFTGSWLVWAPLLGVAIAGLLWTRDLEPLRRLPDRLWADWSLLTFALYGALPLMIVAVYDEVQDKEPVVIGLSLLLGVGAALYLRGDTVWRRARVLLAGFILSWGLAMIHLGLYWGGRQEPWMTRSSTWMETISWTGNMGLILLAILLSPALLAALRLAGRAWRAPRRV